jgi:hypothetical protein
MRQTGCPKCGAPQAPAAVECGYCGVVFAKLSGRSHDEPAAPGSPEPPRPSRRAAPPPEGEPEASPLARLGALLVYVEPRANALVVALRAALLAGLALWSIHFLRIAMQGEPLASSFMHLVNLPFHEGGHILFMPLGDFMMSLGGSLTQLLVPLVCAGALLRRRDTFGASVALWWAGQSLMDMAPYIADARALQLVLLGGQTGAEVEGHDWEAILSTLGWIHHDVAIGRAANASGVVLMLLALAWGAYVVCGQLQRRETWPAP